ncbi:MAG TPA: cystathionine gamma-lyase [Actinomycetota bacterium]|nr:cystathionine gamma-lyase [Actinomycetota bacterium]
MSTRRDRRRPAQGDPLRPPVTFASTYRFAGDPDPRVDMYGRWTNPTWSELERELAELEGGDVVCFASGMAAVTAVLCSSVVAGDTVLLPRDGYYGVRAFAEGYLRSWGVTIRYFETGGLDSLSFSGIRLVWLETPTNPLLDVCDVRSVARRAHEQDALVAVDNTTATVVNQTPLALGADYSVSSDTKGTAGHSDLVAGHVATRDETLAAAVTQWRTMAGPVPGPMEAWLLHRSLDTLALRVERQGSSALAIARMLQAHPAVGFVRYPGLPDDPSHEVAREQMRGFGGVVTFALRDRDAAERFLEASEAIVTATSFGGVHTTAERRARWGSDDVPEGSIRLSVGCEPLEPLVEDLRGALDAAV